MEEDKRSHKRARLEDPSAPAAIEERFSQSAKNGGSIHHITSLTSYAGQREALAAREKRAGISSFVGENTGTFHGVLKARYTDFIVNEVPLSGQVLHLEKLEAPRSSQRTEEGISNKKNTDTTLPKVLVESKSNDSSHGEGTATNGIREVEEFRVRHVSASSQGPPFADRPLQISEKDKSSLQDLFGEKSLSQILSLDEKVRKNPTKRARDFSAFNSEPITDKQTRTTAHQLIRQVFSSRLETTTEEDNTIKFSASPPRKHANSWSRNTADGRTKGKLGWDQLGGENVHFTLYKENKDTMEVVNYLCTQMKVQPRSFAFAGTKDRRAVSTQRLSAYRIHAERLAGLNKSLHGARLGDFKYEPHGLELGDLAGNQFLITLRDCHVPDDEQIPIEERQATVAKHVRSAASRLSDNGFINYYGLQRFGSFDASTDVVGALMLQANYKGAVDKLLEFSETALASYNNENVGVLVASDESRRAGAIHSWRENGSADEALAILPRKYSAESNIIRYLSFTDRKTGRQPRLNDHRGALASISRNLRLMYVHAYQSLVWNTAASRRWELFGQRVVEGDLVMVPKTAGLGTGQELDDDGEIIVRPAEHDAATSAEDAFERARPLSHAEAESGKFSIHDVVLPQPGYDIEYPKNAVGQFYKDFMASEMGGGLDPHNMRRDWKDISLSGAYRPFLARPIGQVEVEFKQYEKNTEQLVETELERLIREGKADQSMAIIREDKQETASDAATDDITSKVAVTIRLQLASSQYATMALREMSRGGVVNYQPEYGTR